MRHQPSTENRILERHAEGLSELTERLAQYRFWKVLPENELDDKEPDVIFDTHSGLLTQSLQALGTFLKDNPFVDLYGSTSESPLATLQSSTQSLWTTGTGSEDDWFDLASGRKLVETARWADLDGWQLPTKDMLLEFAKPESNPHRKGRHFRLLGVRRWLTAGGWCNVDDGFWSVDQDNSGMIFACNTLWQGAHEAEILADLALKQWHLESPTGASFRPDPPDTRWKGLSVDELLQSIAFERVHLCALADPAIRLDPEQFWTLGKLLDLDYTPCRLPKLDRAQVGDPGKGLWELWGSPPEWLRRLGWVARDPGQDLQDRAVAIDFGTSSTVVAMDTANGGRELLRIGVRDFYQPIEARHFENPTVLECLDFTAFEAAWLARAYRPELNWSWMRAAHEAQASFRDNPGDTRILASILPRLKQWALRAARDRIRVTDRQGREIELAPHTERNPVRGEVLAVGPDDPFDPIELYAWYLGMAINWRGRGLFQKYYLSFPVKYEHEVKQRVLASFRRGLQRSLPETLIESRPEVLNRFEVTDLASEPAAYAAAALPRLGIEPSETGVPYAVFDFGGGTTDFDFGLLRWATAEEEHRGYERVFDHLASSGDAYLGGENLLEHLVYASFRFNLDVLREKRIQFTKPIDAPPFAGSEAFLAPTQAAQTNTVMMAGWLRGFLEGDGPELEGQIKLDLIDVNGNKQPCELLLDGDALDGLLAQRIRGGVRAFLAELARLRPELPEGTPIHVLLAGNASRSRHVRALFDGMGKAWPELLVEAFGESPPQIEVHPPLPVDTADPHAPTAKTGVALGLLRLAPGEQTLLIDRVRGHQEGQAPFSWFVGRMRRGTFQPVLLPGAGFREWLELGPLPQSVFKLFDTASPRAHQGLKEGDPELRQHRLEFPGVPDTARLFVRATGPYTIELAAGETPDSLAESPVRELLLQ